MSADSQLIIEKLSNLSVAELLRVQENIIQQLKYKTGVNEAIANPTPAKNRTEIESTSSPEQLKLAHAYCRTPQEIEERLATIFTPEELAQIGRRDFSNRRLEGKSLSQMVIEDRKDRF